MLKINNLEKTYGGQTIFEDISFAMSQGERLGLVGRNGHGKSTLFRLILGEETPDSGKISFPKYYTIGHLSQHIRFTEDTVLKEAALSLPKSEDGIDETYKVEAILMGLGLSQDYFVLHPSALSGGYQIRLNLAKVLASDPNLLLLDEPTNYLDIVSVRWLQRFLKNWKNELIIITHDRDFMDSVTTHTMAIHRCGLKKVSGSTHKLYAQILQEEQIYEQTRVNDEKKRKETEKFINRFRASATKASAVQSRVKALEKTEKLDKLEEIRSLDFEFNAAPFPGKILMEAEDISFGYEAGNLLIDGLRFSVGKKDRIAIIGKNGKGKTTLLNILAGEFAPTSGEVKTAGNLKLAYFGQTNINRLNMDNTVEMEIMEAHPDYNRGAARRICGAMMFEKDNALKKIGVLSGGEKSRVLLGKLLVSPANLLLLDEPTNHLDMDSIDSLVNAIEEYSGAVVIVTHSEMILNSIANRLIIFDGGKVTLFEGTYQDFLDRVGWDGEASEAPKAESKGKNKGVNRKELRRIRAAIVADRLKVLGPLQKKMTEVEEEIVRMEGVVEKAQIDLAAASESGDSASITKYSKDYHDSKQRIDALFEKLDALSHEKDEKTREFELKLAETE